MNSTLTFTPSDFYKLYSPHYCELRLYLSHAGMEPSAPGAFEQVLFRLGARHEKSHLATFTDISDLTNAPDKTLAEIQKNAAAIYQGELKSQIRINDKKVDVVGIPDFMIKESRGYVIRDCKLARHASETEHPEILRQLQLYGWLFEQTTGQKPVRLEVLKGDGVIESLEYEGNDSVISSMHEFLDVFSMKKEPYSPVGWSNCIGCGYREYCMDRAEKSQDLALVYGIDRNLAVRLRELNVFTISDLVDKYDEQTLSELKRPWGSREQKVGKRAASILMQARAMLNKKEIILSKPTLPPAKNYVMFDLEGLPPQLDELDKIYLWGMQVFGEKPDKYRYSLAAPGSTGDKACWENFLSIASEIISKYGDIPFVHWHDYEKHKIKHYIERYGDKNGVAAKVLSLLVDLLPITRNSVVLPEPSYSLKVVEKYIGFKRTQDEYGGEWSIAKYIEAVETEDEGERKAKMDEILKYNEEDLQATWAVMAWLRGLKVWTEKHVSDV